MRKLMLCTLVLVLMVAWTGFDALAIVEVEACEDVVVYTGPGMNYGVVGTFSKGSQMLAYGYESNGNSEWDFVEFMVNGLVYRGYVKGGLAFASASGYANLLYPKRRQWRYGRETLIYAAPSRQAAILGYLKGNDVVTALENADAGDLEYDSISIYRGVLYIDETWAGMHGAEYIYIEYERDGQLNRGYVRYPYE